jgi:diadenosine tetraphosphate (Ap4A) HIT family hydrolase
MHCPFCTLPSARIVKENDFAVLVRDAYPVSPGHSLVIPRYVGDVADPRGGVRWVIADKAKYWSG